MCGLHTGVLEFLEDAARFDTQMLAYFAWVRVIVANQKHTIPRVESIEKR